MILVDAAVWIDHFRAADPVLDELLATGQVLSHPFIVGELALGNLKDRERTLSRLQRLPSAVVARPAETMELIRREPLHGLGLGYVDASLLCAALLTPRCALWTRDRRLLAAAHRLGVAYAQALH